MAIFRLFVVLTFSFFLSCISTKQATVSSEITIKEAFIQEEIPREKNEAQKTFVTLMFSDADWSHLELDKFVFNSSAFVIENKSHTLSNTLKVDISENSFFSSSSRPNIEAKLFYKLNNKKMVQDVSEMLILEPLYLP